MRCAVFNCSNSNMQGRSHSFFRFPKNKKLQNIWLHFCKKSDVKLKSAFICSAHFKEEDFSNNVEFEFIIFEEEDDLAQDGLENLAGYVCHRFRYVIPELQAEGNGQYTWVDHVSEGRLCKPSENTLHVMRQLQEIWEHANGNSLFISNKYMEHHLELAENIDCNIEIKKVAFRSMMYFRLRKLNRELLEISRKRKYRKITT